MRYFVKLHDPDGSQDLDFTLRVARTLNGTWRIEGVLPPLAALSGTLYVFLGPCPISVHPFIQGRNAATREPLTESETIRIGMLVGEFHRSAAALEFMGGPTERFDTECIEILDGLLIGKSGPGGIVGSVLDLLARNREALHDAMAVLKRLQDRARAARFRYAITHGDLTLHNFMVDEDERFHVIDWDSALLAPVERDLIFFGETGFEPFLCGYARTTALEHVNIDLLSFFAYRWCLDGIAFFANRLLAEDVTSDRTETDLAVLQTFLPFDAKKIGNTISSMERIIRKLSPRA
jgi:Ser/Thr protein kinase RdoA (MazF antagonist)